MVFSQWYSGAAVCSPSRAAMVTGRLPIRSGCAGPTYKGGVFYANAVSGLPPNETTFATILSEQGYRSKMIGKWHLGVRPGFLPTDHGFDEYLGIPFSVDMSKSPWSLDSDILQDTPPNASPLPLIKLSKGDKNITVVQQPVDLTSLSETYTNAAISFIKENKEQPFILYFAFNHVHVPNFVSPEFCNTTLRGQFGDALKEMDNVIGAVMNAIDQEGQKENTLTFFTSDNGPWIIYCEQGGNAGPFRDGKFTTWEGGFREPAIVHYPNSIPEGTVTQEIATTMDIFTTVVTLGGGKIPDDRIIDGKNLAPIFSGSGKSEHEAIFYYAGTPNACPKKESNCPGLRAIRIGDYKMHWASKTYDTEVVTIHDPPLLYNVAQDIGESWPIFSKEDEYANWRPIFEQMKEKHENSVVEVDNQMAKGGDNEFYICCDPDSKEKYPQYMQCTCSPNNWHQQLCIRKL